MRYLIILITILAFIFQVKSQTKIVGYEYWFDDGFSSRVVTPVAPSAQLDINSNIPTGGVNTGIHSFNFRSWDDSLRYSSIISQFFYKTSSSSVPTNRNIVAYEYWFDNDYGNAITQSVTSQQSLDLTTIIATGTINSGIHSFNIRFKDDTELWSSTLSQFFYKVSSSSVPTNRNIVTYEYWFDNDYGNAITQSVTNQQSLDLTTIITTGTINSGIHSFNIRFKDDTELWSSTLSQFFYKISPSSAPTNRNIVAYEYWFDNDYGNAITQSVTNQQSLDLTTIITTGTINSGIHSFNIRFKDDTELWSSTLSQFFYKVSSSSVPTNRNIVAYEYWFDNDYGNAITQNVTSQQSLDLTTIITTGTINSGIHSFNIRFKDDTELWSSTLSQFFYKIPEQANLVLNKITTYRYWLDNDFTQANTVTLTTPVQQFNLIDNLDFSQTTKGIHSIHFQFKDSLNIWSSVVSDSISKLPLPIANFGFNSTSNCDSTIIAFADSSIDGDVYLWTFGDGDTSIVVSPTHAYQETGVYNVSLTVTDTATGLDSTILVPIEVKMSTLSTVQETACGSFISPSGNYVWTTSNTYLDTIPNSNNCDSIITYDLTIINPASSIDSRTACDSLLWIDGNTYYSSNNIATYTILGGAANTCDSIITLDLTINTVDVSVTTADPIITANVTGAAYQWLDCNNNSVVINGETSQTFTATTNGTYAVEVTQNSCVDTSACTAITTVEIIVNDFGNEITLFPNPTKGEFTIDLGINFESSKIVITDTRGKLIQSTTFEGGQTLNMSIDQPSGIYILTIMSGDKKAVIQLVKN